jgi:hypothetical protein
MTLSVVGLGLVSPAGASARDHVFFPRAEGPPPAPSPFLDLEGKRVDAGHCPWVPSPPAGAGRMIDLARAAVAEAIATLPAQAAGAVVFLVTPPPRPGLSAEEIATLVRAVSDHARAPSIQVLTGAAGAFAALARIAAAIAARQISAALLVGVDSFLTVEALTERALRPPSPFLLAPPPPAEGAAALLLTSPAEATRLGLGSLGELTDSRHAPGRGTDDDDEPVDGAAMTALLRGLPASGPVRSVFGQGQVGLLRAREWQFAVARCAERFDSSYVATCLEADVGELGAAAGVASLALAFATFRHGAAPKGASGPLVAWALSRDGTRGIALGSPAPAAKGALVPLGATARARRVPQEPPAPAAVDFVTVPDDTWLAEEPALGGDTANDIAPLLSPLLHGVAPLPSITLDPRRRPATTLADFHASVVSHAAELAGALARARLASPRREVARIEARLLRQIDAVVAAGPRALADVAAFQERRAADPWAAFAGAICAAAFEGDEAIDVLRRAIHALPPAAEDHLLTVTEALRLSDHPGLSMLATELCTSPHAPARAVGFTLRSLRGELPFDGVHAAFTDEAPSVVRAAIWASERLPTAQRALFQKLLQDRTRSPSIDVAWSAARVLAIRGDGDLRRDALEGPLGAHLGQRSAELFVLCGAPADWPRLEALLGRHRTTRALLSSVARFGSPASAPWLIQRLDDDALADHAAAALVVLFGTIVSPDEMLNAAAWRRAVSALGLDASARIRRGRPWSLAVVADECASGDLSRAELELRIDELRARSRQPDAVDVDGWYPDTEARLNDLLARVRR